MRSISLQPGRHTARIRKTGDFIFTVLLFLVLIFVLSYFFDRGAEYAAEAVVNIGPPEPR